MRVTVLTRYLLILCLFVCSGLVSAQQTIAWTSDIDGRQQVNLYFFWSPTCPHCQDARGFIESLPQQYSWIQLHSFNVLEDRQHLRRYQAYAASLGQQAQSVPGFFVCGQLLTGWDSPAGMGKQLVSIAGRCLADQTGQADQPEEPTVQVPMLGEVSADGYSLPLFTIIIAGLDAFNPCAFFVLLFLLSLMVHARSRWRMLLIGGTFVLISGLAYFVFMAAWLNLFFLVGSLPWITLVAGLLAVTIGLFGIKDFFWFQQGPSLSISDENKPRLYSRMRQLLSVDSMPTMMFSTIVLAVVANGYELLCTAGFPMVYTRTLTLHELDGAGYYLYLLLYNLVYVIPLAIIVIIFTVSLGARKLTVDQGRLLKLLSGVMMLGLGLILAIKPALLNNVFTGILLLVTAIVLTLLARIYLNRHDSMPPGG